jgi:hypothetical protein
MERVPCSTHMLLGIRAQQPAKHVLMSRKHGARAARETHSVQPVDSLLVADGVWFWMVLRKREDKRGYA